MSSGLIGGRYRLERELGRGGFGAVYVAVQEDLGRRVAVKMLLGKHTTWVGFERFQREARLAQHLSHPNTVRLFDFGMHESTPFIVFELLNGEPLSSLIHRTGPLPLPQVVRIVSQILKSLMEAHGLGVVHRDIKPANVFVCAYAGESDFVKVLDFGIAKSVESESVALTETGEAIGTPAYMSPEQLSGATISPATDVYAVGLLMAEMIAGKRAVGGSAMEAAMRQLDPNPLSFAPTVTESPLFPIIERATRKAPEQRFADAAQMLSALSTFGTATIPPTSASSIPTAPVSGTIPGYAGPYTAGAIAATDTGTIPYARSSTSIPPPRRGRAVWALGGALFVFGGGALVVVLALIAAFFVDWSSLVADSSPSVSADGGVVATSVKPDVDAGATSTPTPGTPAGRSPGGAPVGGGTSTSTASSDAGSTTPSTTASGATLGKSCMSNKDCTGAYQECGNGAVCVCKVRSTDWNAPRQCGNACVANTDPNNCGACGKRCADDEVCTTGQGGSIQNPICVKCAKALDWGGPLVVCGPHLCVATNANPSHCGGCNIKCAKGQSCVNGVCK